MVNEERFKLRMGPMSPETVEMARVELRETPEVREVAIVDLRNLLHAATDLHYRDDDEFLLIFLRACHFYPQGALEKMRTTAEFRKEHAPLVKGLMPQDEMSSFLEHQVVNVLSECDQKGRRVLIVNCGAIWDPKAVTPDSLFRLFYLIHIAAQLELEGQVRGVVVLMDFDGLSMKQVRGLSPSFSRRLITFIQDAMPLRLKEVHIVKQPFIFKMVWALFKPFIREKLNKRMHFHGSDMTSLHKFLDPDFLPAEYGGNKPAMDYGGKDWYPCIIEHEKFYKDWSEFGFANQ